MCPKANLSWDLTQTAQAKFVSFLSTGKVKAENSMHIVKTGYENTLESKTTGYEIWHKILVLQIPEDPEKLILPVSFDSLHYLDGSRGLCNY